MRGYYSITRITDFGPYVTKLILPVGQKVKTENLSKDQFSVYVERRDMDGKLLMVPKSFLEMDQLYPSRGYTPVTRAYASDRMGNESREGECITLDLAYGPIYRFSSGLCAGEGGHEFFTNNCYRITQIQTIPGETEEEDIVGLVFDDKLKNYMPDIEGFLNSVSGYEPMPLRYGYYIPQTGSGKKPLIVWLHGAGEGGWETTISYAGNKVVALASEKIQAYFGGAYIFCPQCETFWMDDGSGEITENEKSIYGEALMAAIAEFVEKNPAIDRDRIYIGGDSNGGFMTMRMLMDYPDYFAAAFPICEAMIDTGITDEEIGKLKEIPIWFTHAANDPIVPIERFVLPTYERLIKAGGENIHLTMWDRIVDLYEGFQDEEGNPYEYLGHFAWIPLLNDDCRLDYDKQPVQIDGKEVTLLQWLAAQKKR